MTDSVPPSIARSDGADEGDGGNSEATSFLDVAVKKSVEKTEPKFALLERRDLLAQDIPAPSWIVPNLIPRAALVFFAGRPGSYKTFFALKVACRLSEGKSLFDAIECTEDATEYAAPLPTGNVLFIEEEMNIVLMHDRLKRLSSPPPDEASLYFLLSQNVQLNREEDVRRLRELCIEKKISTIFMDPFSSIVGVDDENDNAKVARVLTLLRNTLIDDVELACTVVLIHHPAKSETGSESSLRGAGDITGKADHVLKFSIDKTTRAVTVSALKSRQVDLSQVPDLEISFRNFTTQEDDEEKTRIEVVLTKVTREKFSDGDLERDTLVDRIEQELAVMITAKQKDVVDALGLTSRSGAFKDAWKKMVDTGQLIYDQKTKSFSLKSKPLSSKEVSRIYASGEVAAPPLGGID